MIKIITILRLLDYNKKKLRKMETHYSSNSETMDLNLKSANNEKWSEA